MGLLDALADKDFRAGVARGVNDAAYRGIGNLVGMPVDAATNALNLLIAGGGYVGHKAGLLSNPPPLIDPEKAIGSSEWIGRKMQDAGLVSPERNALAEGLASFALPGAMTKAATGLGALELAATDRLRRAIAARSEATARSRSAKMLDPKPVPQRPFNDDYPQAVGGNDGSRIAADIEGRPLTARYIAGRRVVGGPDQALDRVGVDDVGRLLGVTAERAPASGQLNGDAGRYVRSRTADGNTSRRILIDQSLTPDQAAKVQSHELGHTIDDMVFGLIGPKGSKIPTDGISQELRKVYSDLNSLGYVPKGKLGASPKGFGYPANQTDSELMAEAIRAYMVDPNYLKSVAPKTAARIREYVNSNPNLNSTIQFNSIGGGLIGGGLLGGGIWGDGDAGQQPN